MKKILLSVVMVLAFVSVGYAQNNPVPVVIKKDEGPKPNKRGSGLHIGVGCNLAVIGDGVSTQFSFNVTNWPTVCSTAPNPFRAPDTTDGAALNVSWSITFFDTSGSPVGSQTFGPYSVPIAYDGNGTVSFTFPSPPPAGVSLTVPFNIYYTH